MKRCHKGILGVRKDPKLQILFSFSAREGEEWPSDDSDSDFLPSDEEDINLIRFVNFHIYMYIWQFTYLIRDINICLWFNIAWK